MKPSATFWPAVEAVMIGFGHHEALEGADRTFMKG